VSCPPHPRNCGTGQGGRGRRLCRASAEAYRAGADIARVALGRRAHIAQVSAGATQATPPPPARRLLSKQSTPEEGLLTPFDPIATMGWQRSAGS
jgi:hypothetical protein